MSAPSWCCPVAAEIRPALSVGFVLANRFTLTALATFLDALRLAADDGDGSRPIRCRWTIMGPAGAPVRASCGLAFAEWQPFQDPRRFDYVVLVGGLLHGGEQLDAESAAYLKSAAAAGIPLIGICTGSFALARIGLMAGRRCCVSWYHYSDYAGEFEDVEIVADRLYLVDGDRITCSGGAGVADLAAYLIERHLGPGSAQKSLHIMQIDRARPGSQAQPQPPGESAADDPRVRRAMLLMEQSLADPLSVEEIASRLDLSPRQLERLFRLATGKGPAAFYRTLRLRYGRWLLDNSARSITEIALECGFADGAHFSRQFRDAFGTPPSLLRAAARTTGPRSDRRPYGA